MSYQGIPEEGRLDGEREREREGDRERGQGGIGREGARERWRDEREKD